MHSQKLSLALCAVLLIVAAGCGRKTDTGGTTGTTHTAFRSRQLRVGSPGEVHQTSSPCRAHAAVSASRPGPRATPRSLLPQVVPVPGGPALGDEGPVLEVPPVIVPAGL